MNLFCFHKIKFICNQVEVGLQFIIKLNKELLDIFAVVNDLSKYIKQKYYHITFLG